MSAINNYYLLHTSNMNIEYCLMSTSILNFNKNVINSYYNSVYPYLYDC